MKINVLKRDNRFDLKNDKGLGVQAYGAENDYPQQLIEIVDASGTAKSCVNTYAKFISGKGFEDVDFYGLIVNRFKQTNDYLSNQIAKDFSKFGGFALHINYNLNYKVSEVQHIPFEHVRFQAANIDTGYFDKVAIHPDWGKRFTSIRKFKKEDIQFIDFFNSDVEIIKEQIENAGGFSEYKGQVFYFSNAGERVYPTPIFDAVLTDMSTEEGISNVSYRNVRNNFLSAGMLINTLSKGAPTDSDRENDLSDSVRQFQGDEQAGKIMYVELEDGDTEPKFVSFKGTNYDKEFTATLESSQANIGKVFNQPPILRAEDVGSNFGSDLIKNAYNYYNSITENERLILERTFFSIFSNWWDGVPTDNFTVTPLSYEVDLTLADRLGEKQLSELMAVLNNVAIGKEDKKAIAITIFGLTNDEIKTLFT